MTSGTDEVDEDDRRMAAGLVLCDEESCLAPNKPDSPEGYRLAYQHWRYHSRINGCSHGC